MHRVLVGTALVAACATSLAVLPAHADGIDTEKQPVAVAAGDDHQQLDQLNQRLSEAEAALVRSQAELTAAEAALATARTQRQQAEVDDQVLTAAVAQAESALAATRVAVSLGRQNLEREQQVAGAVVRQTTQQSTPLLGVAALVTNLTTGDVNEQVQWSTTLFGTTQSRMDALRTLQSQVEVAQQAQETARARVDEAKRTASTHVVETRGAEARATALAAELSARVRATLEAKREFEAQLAQEYRRQTALRSEASSVEDKIRARMALLSNEEWGGSPASGALPLPVAGPITSAYGMRLHPVTHDWSLHDGTDFGAACGTPIRAPRAGVVVEEYFNAGYGNRLILDHGIIDGHFLTTGYNHAERYVVQVGDRVSSGQVIGYVGTTGYSTGCHLHLMAWQDGRVVDPMARWF
ncbi:MAG TPA: peptidoglycan DD-metalloendopeptidase family protein [Propionibacteriaceae bacterium]|nr:peptidoglycan DD-metalloendopeptidase family protein [Propionibacteriaceae bacterium]